MEYEAISGELEDIATEIVDAAFNVHTALGPGLLESVYEACLAHELELRDLSVERQVYLPVSYGGMTIKTGLRLDLLVEDSVIIELKAVEEIIPLHKSQLLTYLKLSNKRLGFLINFNVNKIKNGIKRFVL